MNETLLARSRHKNHHHQTSAALSMRAAREANNDLNTTLTILKASLDGLTDADANLRLQENGPNETAHEKAPHWTVQLLATFKNPFILVLATLAAISIYLEPDDLTGPIIIGTMIVLSVILRFWQEFRSTRAAEALQAMVRTTATVLRRNGTDAEGDWSEIPMRDLVVGDIVRLGAGDMIPADVRLIESKDLFVSQAVLTGESIPVEKYDTLGAVAEKSADAIAPADAGPLDLDNICFMGTNVVSGQGRAVVVVAPATRPISARSPRQLSADARRNLLRSGREQASACC